jgi:hypothetical protein
MKLHLSYLTVLLATLAACGGDRERPARENGGNDDKGGAETKFFLPTGDDIRNTANPTIEIDSAGNSHLIYPAYAFGDAFYAYCDGDCDSAGEVKVVRFDTDGTIANAMLALDENDRPHVLLSAFQKVYYGSCHGDCTVESDWTLRVILEHESDAEREISGEAFALAPGGKPRFMMHSYRAFLGIGAPPPASFYVECNESCHEAASWKVHQVAEQVWQESSLALTAAGFPRIATVAIVDNEQGIQEIGGYIECNANCELADEWKAVGLSAAYSDRNISLIDPAISLALDSKDAPRLLVLGKNAEGARSMTFFACEGNCADGNNWAGTGLITDERLGAGLDLALDHDDRPRVVYTAASNIFLAWCKSTDCASMDSPWDLKKVEFGSDMPPDKIFPYPNCTVAAWFLRHPSVAIAEDNSPRVVYRAEDISGGVGNPDPTDPDCVAGADMTWSRFARINLD